MINVQKQIHGRFNISALTVIALLIMSACSNLSSKETNKATKADDPSSYSAVVIPESQITLAIKKLDSIAISTMKQTGVPGISIAVVHNDKLVYAKGFGVRQAGSSEMVDENTVFQLASLSKAVGATVVAGVVGDGIVNWNDPVVKYLPDFVLSDAYTTEHVTIADLYSHRSGLPDHAGDLLEDLGYDRHEVLNRLRYLPLDPFRITYHYTNFGLTAAAEAVAKAAGSTWEALSQKRLYSRLGMSSTSSTYADFMAQPNKALGNVLSNGTWIPTQKQREPDAQSPAGGVSSSAKDMAKWMRMVLGDGQFEGKQVIASAPLRNALNPQITSKQAGKLSDRPGSYGLGFNVSVDGAGRTRFSHSGAFMLGAGTSFTLLPSEKLGIVVLTNGMPVGAPEAISNSFMDIVETGSVTFDWLGMIGKLFEQFTVNHSILAGKTPPSNPVASLPHTAYVGSYANTYYGIVDIVEYEGKLQARMGPKLDQTLALKHWDGNIFSYIPGGEDAVGISAVTFAGDGNITSITIENINEGGMGTFTRYK